MAKRKTTTPARPAPEVAKAPEAQATVQAKMLLLKEESPKPANLITQAELQRYAELLEQSKPLVSAKEALEKSLKARLEAHVPVEIGAMTARIENGTPRANLSFEKLADVVGSIEALRIKSQIPESTPKLLRVEKVA